MNAEVFPCAAFFNNTFDEKTDGFNTQPIAFNDPTSPQIYFVFRGFNYNGVT